MIESGDCVANELEDRTLMMSGSSKLLVFLSRKYTGFELNFKIFDLSEMCLTRQATARLQKAPPQFFSPDRHLNTKPF